MNTHDNSVMGLVLAGAAFFALMVAFGVALRFGPAYYWSAALYATAAVVFAALSGTDSHSGF